MYSKFLKFPVPLFKNCMKDYVSCRLLNTAASEHQNIKKFKLIKRLASTVLFGGTFVAVLLARKRKSSKSFDEAKLVSPNPNYHKNFKLYEYKGFILPMFVMKSMDNVRNFRCRDDDIFVVSFPKTGSTWLQEIVYCILKGFDESASKSIEERFPYLEFIYPGLSFIEKIPEQRLIKTHLPYSLLPEDIHKKKPKILYIMRNPKDVVVSYYHFVRMMTVSNYVGDFETFLHDFLDDKIPYGPVWKHYSEMWEHRNDENVLILFYEDFQKDIHESIKRIAEFLNKDLTAQEVFAIANHCSFHNMRHNPSVNYQHWDDLGIRKQTEAKFMRKGEVGDWKNYLNSETNHIMDLWINEHFKKISSLFLYDIHKPL
ncbi:Sulfotransferase 4A1, partial [Stegodyphus mimosarum]